MRRFPASLLGLLTLVYLSISVIPLSAVGQDVTAQSVVSRSRQAPILFAADEIRSALSSTGASIGQVILEAPTGKGKAESFRISVTRTGVTITGADTRGVMYGGLDVAEQIRLGGRNIRIQPRTGSPYLRVRAIYFNPPLKGSTYLSAEQEARSAWFYDLDYWHRYFTAMAYDRINVVSFWASHPFDQMVRLAKYPEATDLPADELDRRIAFFHDLFRMARDHGIDTYLITWNIHMSAAFKKAHGLRDGQDSPLIRDYQKECIKALLKEYPELTGIGTCPGEAMGHSGEWREQWIRDTYFKGIEESGRTVPFIHRYWGAEPKPLAKMLADLKYPAPMMLDIKFNGEHMYSSTRPHVQDQTWFTQKPRPYTLLWHLRNDCLMTFRWFDPEFVRAVVKNCGGPDSDGFVMGSSTEMMGEDFIHTPQTAGHKTWKDEFEKNWARFSAWGRFGYDPNESDTLWQARFAARFGPRSGKDVFTALSAASRIIPLVSSFHWNYMNGDWYPEGNVGGWNTNYEVPYANLREPGMFHTVNDWIFNNTIDDTLQNIPEYVADRISGRRPAKGILTPMEVADRLDAAANSAADSIALADVAVTTGKNEWECTRADLKAVIALGHYYADKIRGATELMSFYVTGREQHRRMAVASLEHAAHHWQQIAEVADAHYIRHEIWLMGQFDWGMYVSATLKDIETARQATPWTRVQQTWKWSNGATTVSTLDWDVSGWSPTAAVKPGDGVIAQWARIFRERALAPAVPADAISPRSGMARTSLVSASGGKAILHVVAPGAVSIELNGARLSAAADCIMPVTLNRGENELVVRYGQVPKVAPKAYLEQLPSGATAIYIEAESGVLQAPMRSQRNTTAAGGTVVLAPLGTGLGFDEATGKILDKGWAEYRVHIPRTGAYRLWARGYWADGYSDSFFVAWDGGKPTLLGNDSTYKRWHWVQMEPIQFATGEHRLRIHTRGDGALLDCIVVSPVE